ncbi:MAG: hypothetical protein ACTSQC_12535, partial [Candidatus Heimdallarchaeaceae archaeon]
MSESPKEKPQTLSGYVSLVKKIENIINQITEDEELAQTEEVDSLEQQDSEIVTDKESATEAVTKVEKQTLQLEESITKVADEEKKDVQAERLPDLVKIEKELGELYPGAEVQVTDFYYAKDELPDDEIKKRIMSKIPSLEAIDIKSKKNYGFPFVLCKLEGHYEAIIPINLENISLPTIQHGVNRQFKLLFAGTEEVLELTPSENEIWNQSFNRFQIKLTQLLNTKVKSNLSKKPYKMKLINLDSILIKDFINEYHKKLKNLQNY